jgi:hypothetical protein
MGGEWPVVRVGDVCYVTDGAHAKVDRQQQGVLYLTSKKIGVGRLLLDDVDYISEQDYERLFSNSTRSQRRLSPGDVLLGIIGTFGNAYLYMVKPEIIREDREPVAVVLDYKEYLRLKEIRTTRITIPPWQSRRKQNLDTPQRPKERPRLE